MRNTLQRRQFIVGTVLAALSPTAGHSADSSAERLRKLVAEHLKVDQTRVTAKASFTQLGADDLDMVELVMATEEAFNIEIPDETAKALKTFGDLTRVVDGARKAQGAPKMAPGNLAKPR